MAKKYTKSEIEGMIKSLEAKEKKARSKWGKAVLQDAQWLLENVIEGYDEPYELSENLVLNGAENWNKFSWGGSALVDNGEIAEHYGTPSELKKVGFNKENMYVEKQPNANEEWLDVQARALRQAWWAIRDEMNDTTEFSMSLCNFSYQDVDGNFKYSENFRINHIEMKELNDIKKAKEKLIRVAKKKGLYENFGQKEVRELQDKYGYTDAIREFDNWCMNIDISYIDNNNFSYQDVEGLKYRKTKGQGKDSNKGKKSNFSIDYICEETCDLADFPAWSGGKERLDEIIELGIEDEAEDYIKEMFYGETPTDTQINDLLWFDMDDWIEEHREHKGNFGISNNPNYFGDWYGEGQIDKEKILNNDGEGDVYLVKIWSGSGYALDVYLVRAIDFYEAIDIVFEWSRKNEKDMIFSREEVEKFAEDAWKDYGKGKGGEKEDFIEDYIDTEFIASSDYDLFARSENFFVDKVPQEGDNLSIVDDTKDVFRATGKLAGNIVKNTTDKGGILMF